MPGNKIISAKSAARAQLLILTLLALAGLGASGLWLWTAQKSCLGLMIERRISQDQPVSPKTLVQVWEQSRNLEQAVLPGRHLHLPGLLSQFIVFNHELPRELRAEALVEGQESAHMALARDPAHAHAWARLAGYSYIFNGPSPDTLAALKMSIYAAPAKRSLMFWRLNLAGACRDYWNEEFEDLIRRQIILAWRISPPRLAEIAVESDMVNLTRQVLSRSPQDLQRFEELAGAVYR